MGRAKLPQILLFVPLVASDPLPNVRGLWLSFPLVSAVKGPIIATMAPRGERDRLVGDPVAQYS